MAPRLGRKNHNVDFTTGPITKNIFLFAIPALLGDIFSALYNVVDTIVVGQFVGSGALAAVGTSFGIHMVTSAVYAGFGMGSGILTAQMFGAKRHDQLTATVNTAYIGAFFIGTSMILIGQLVANPLLRLLNTPDSIMEMASAYLRVYFLGCTGQLFYLMGSNMLRGLGDSRWPTYALVFCAVLNTLLDLLFVVVFHWSVTGAAAATVISQLLSGILVVIRIYTGNYGIEVHRSNFKIHKDIFKKILTIGIPGSLQLGVTSVGTMILTRFANGFGEDLVATNSIVQKIEQFSLLPATAIGTALRMFIGQNLGAGNKERTKEGMRKTFVLIRGIGLFMGLADLILARVLCRAFVSNEVVIAMGVEAIRIIAFFFVIHAAQMSLGGVLTGAGATRPVMYVSFIGIAMRVLCCYLFAVRTGHWQGLFWATNTFYLIVAAIYAVYIWKGDWMKYVAVKPRRPLTESAQETPAAEAKEQEDN